MILDMKRRRKLGVEGFIPKTNSLLFELLKPRKLNLEIWVRRARNIIKCNWFWQPNPS
jgi:hypothetical protein